MKNFLRPYIQLIRLYQPIGFFLLLWPTLSSLMLAGRKIPELNLLLVFLFCTFLMRSAGCIINDCIDEKIDKKITRTKIRPLPSGHINKKKSLFLFFILILILFFTVLFYLKKITIYLGILGLILSCIYPLIKRYCLPQVFLGLTFGLSVPISWSSISNFVSIECCLLFLAVFFWTIAYDTQYAMMDMQEDIKIGIKSTAVLFKGKLNKFIIGMLQINTLLMLLMLGIKTNLNIFYWISIFFIGVLFIYQQKLISEKNCSAYLKSFLSNNYVGLLLFLGSLFNTKNLNVFNLKKFYLIVYEFFY